jgi:sirohydrochlorin cobaltochelatase
MYVTTLPLLQISRPGWYPTLGPAMAEDGLLLVGHGSYCAVSGTEMSAIGRLVADAMPNVAVEVGYLEMSMPPAGIALDRLVARGVKRVTILPMMLLAAGHSKSDVPAVVVEGRLRHPGISIVYGRPFGVDHALCTIAHDNIAQAGGTGLPLLVIARGTSDPDANGEACRASRLLAEFQKAPFVVTGFSGVTGPRVPEALDMCVRLGATKLTVFSWFICNGKLVQRIVADERAFAAERGIEIIDAGYFGPDARLVPIILERYREARAGKVTMSCDTCAYRLPFPGEEDRVGQPIGVGHSHLAFEHRTGHAHDHADHGHGHSHASEHDDHGHAHHPHEDHEHPHQVV